MSIEGVSFDGVWIYSGEAFARIEYFPADLVQPNLLKCPAEILVWSILGYDSACVSFLSTQLISCSLMIQRCKDYKMAAFTLAIFTCMRIASFEIGFKGHQDSKAGGGGAHLGLHGPLRAHMGPQNPKST